jgi:hypothetical protein
MALCLIRSFRELPPTHFARITVFAMLPDRELTRLVSKFLRALKRQLRPHACEYAAVSEWTEGRHFHLLIRTGADLPPALFGEVLRKALGDVPSTFYCRPVKSAAASARYVTKNVKDDSKAELVPQEFADRVVNFSRGFLVRPMADLWREQLAEWYPPSRPRQTEERSK